MDGEENQSWSPAKSPVPQIPVEYDDLNMANGTFASMRNFSTDINRKMKVRLITTVHKMSSMDA